MKCREFIEFLMDYFDGEIDDEQRAIFEKHITDCPPCGTYLESYQLSIKLGRSACGCPSDPDATTPPPAMPEQLVQAIVAAHRKQCGE